MQVPRQDDSHCRPSHQAGGKQLQPVVADDEDHDSDGPPEDLERLLAHVRHDHPRRLQCIHDAEDGKLGAQLARRCQVVTHHSGPQPEQDGELQDVSPRHPPPQLLVPAPINREHVAGELEHAVDLAHHLLQPEYHHEGDDEFVDGGGGDAGVQPLGRVEGQDVEGGGGPQPRPHGCRDPVDDDQQVVGLCDPPVPVPVQHEAGVIFLPLGGEPGDHDGQGADHHQGAVSQRQRARHHAGDQMYRRRVASMIEQLAQRGGALGAAGLLAIQAVQVQIRQHSEAAQEVHPPWSHPLEFGEVVC
mmetsp:Transcript_16607/g.49685  ORF Transcript_16607/g.49685 Transcript_16607/m.49685 type:complete len:302 (+) Transcript_16607:441-1346(+)